MCDIYRFTRLLIRECQSCRRFYAFSSLAGVASISFGNMLVLLRVVMLWDRNTVCLQLVSSEIMAYFDKKANCHLAHARTSHFILCNV